MATMKMQQPVDPVAAESETLSEAEELDVEALRASIRDLEEKEAALTEKLAQAKAVGLTDQSQRCRALLQRVVMLKQSKKDELREAEARQLADELDGFADELENELDPLPIDPETIEMGYNHLAKSKRLNLIGSMIRFIGVFACVAGALLYLILTQPETLNVPFEWSYLIIVGVALVVFLVVSAIIKSAANSHKRIADEIEAERQLAEQERAERARADMLALDRLEAATEAYALEDAGVPKKKNGKLLNAVKIPEIPENVKKKVHIIVPVAAVCTAALTAACVSSSQKKSAAAKRSAAVRREFFNWLG